MSAEISPTLALGGLAIHLSAKAVRTQLRHLNKTRIIIAAHPTPDTDQESTELWCFPWDTAIQRARPGKDPSPASFEYLHHVPVPAGRPGGSPTPRRR